MQITMDVSRLVLRFLEKMDPTGVDRVTLAYVRHLSQELPQTTRALLRWRGFTGMLSAAQSQKLFALLLRGHRGAEHAMAACLLRGIVSTWLNGDGKSSLLLQTAHQDVETESFWRSLRWHGLRPVFFVHDLIPLSHPQYCREGDAQLHRQRLLRMQQGFGIITNSWDSKRQLDSFYQEHGLGAPPTAVGALGCEVTAPQTITLQTVTPKIIALRAGGVTANNGFDTVKEGAGEIYFICLGTIEPRKNHRLLLDVWRQLLALHALQAVPVLRVIGQSGWGCEALEQELLDAAWHQGRVQWLRNCSDAELQRQMQGASALLFPTHTEGFGLPLAEALAAGLPVIASDLAVFREFAGDVPEYLRPDDVPSWVQAVKAYAQPKAKTQPHGADNGNGNGDGDDVEAVGSERRQAQLNRLSSWQPPSWEAHFAVVMPWLEALWQQHVQQHIGAGAGAGAGEGEGMHQRLLAAGWQPGRPLYTVGFSGRKKKMLQRWLAAWQTSSLGLESAAGDPVASTALSSTPAFAEPLSSAPVSFVWGGDTAATPAGSRCIHVEDGMIRSVGLGADLVAPLSWVFDTRGIYFDATRPSDLEYLLRTRQFEPELLRRAALLRERLVALKITKYNLAGTAWQRPAPAKQVNVNVNAHVILVAGQVETDASIRLGSAQVRSNVQLLQAVRQMRPDSYIVYKPHPDVLAGLRAGAVEAQTVALYDELVTEVDINSLYAHVDELHVISSLSGFEAILRGLKVVCHGMPFYAGWGLCEAPELSAEVQRRRGRALSVDELTAGVLLDYASYRNPRDGSVWSAEQALDELAVQSARAAAPTQSTRFWKKLRRHALAAWARWRGYF